MRWGESDCGFGCLADVFAVVLIPLGVLLILCMCSVACVLWVLVCCGFVSLVLGVDWWHVNSVGLIVFCVFLIVVVLLILDLISCAVCCVFGVRWFAW